MKYEFHRQTAFSAYYTASHSFERHIHSDIEIAYCFSGQQTVIIGGTRYSLSEGEAAVIFPHQAHEYVCEKNSRGNHIALICDSGVISTVFPFIKNHIPKSALVPADKIHAETRDAFSRAIDCQNRAAVFGYALVILSGLMENLELRKTETLPDSTAARLVSYVYENYNRNITLKSISREFGMSEYYLSHVFSKCLNINFRRFLDSVRTEKAAALLNTQDLSMTQIAEQSGFYSQRTFNRAFKSIYEMTPREYKKGL